MICPVSCMIFTLDEEVNLPHCLDSLGWCDDVIVIDSGSTDRTLAIAGQAGARVLQHPFEGFGTQRNWALDHAEPEHPWVLILDADERTTPELVRNMSRLIESRPEIGAARVARRFMMWGKWLRYSSQYPVWVVRLVHRDRVRYINRGHAETQQVKGEIAELAGDLIDENHKDLSHWHARQARYAVADAHYELDQEQVVPDWRDIVSSDPMVRRAFLKRLGWRMPFRGLVYFLYSYLLCQGFRDGAEGWRFCRMRAGYQSLVVREKRKIRNSQPT